MSDIKWKMKDHRNCFDLRKDFNLIIMNRNKKIYKTLMGVTLASSLVLSGAVPQNGLHITQVSAASEQNQEKRMIYVDGTKSDSGDGTSKANAVNSLEKAKELSTEGAKILVCGTITISEETTLRMPTQFEVSRAEGFTGPILAVTGKGKATLTYAWLNESDVDTTKADLGKSAFVVGQKEEQKAEQGETKDQDTKKENTKEENTKEESSEKTDTKEDASKDSEESNQKETEQQKKTAPEVVFPGSLTMSEPGALNTLSLTENFSGDGTFRFAEPDKVMDTYQSQQQIIFTPNDIETYDYSGVEGWSEQGGEVVRYITVFVDSLKSQEAQGGQEGSKEEAKDENSQENKNETVTENPAEDTVQEENKNTSEQTPSDSENESETTEETKETVGSEEGAQENAGEQQIQETENTGKEKDASGETSNKITGEQTVRNTQNQETAEPDQTEEKAPIGNLEDSATGIKVDGDFLPPYVDLRVSKITDSDIEEVDIEAILKSYEITLWNLKTDEEYEVPEGKKVTVRIPVPEGAQLYESLIIAHYMEEKGEYEYFIAGQNLNLADGYLVFETASFSPFNIGGNQLVGIGTKSPNHKPSVSYYSDATAGSLTMVPAAGNTMASSKTASNSGTKKNSTDSSVKSGIVVASSGIGTNLNRSSSGQSDSSVTPIEKPILLTSQGSGAVSESTTASTSASSNAKTGDSMNLFAWMGTAVASFAIMVKADLTRKRRRKSRKYMKK